MQFPSDLLRQCWFVAGPTGVGKTASAIELATALEGEIVSLDSMSLYRGMDIGTAKPSLEERRRVPHHLIDILDPHEEFSLAEYVSTAHRQVKEIVGRNRRPLFVGGTGLYLRGLLRGVFDGPPANWELRRELEAESDRPDALHARLRRVDPDAASRLHPNDVRRVVRALEVFHVTGKTLSEQHRNQPLPVNERPAHVFWLEPERNDLYDRINRRVLQMLEAGLIEEVRQLVERPEGLGRTARQALGYKEVIDYLHGDVESDRLAELIQTRTRQFAKRQFTWFRNLVEVKPVPVRSGEDAVAIAARLRNFVEQ